jgi:hypothetical protein
MSNITASLTTARRGALLPSLLPSQQHHTQRPRRTYAHCLRINGGLPHLVASQLQHQPLTARL